MPHSHTQKKKGGEGKGGEIEAQKGLLKISSKGEQRQDLRAQDSQSSAPSPISKRP